LLEAETIVDDKFRIVSCIARGGFGITYLAEQLGLQRRVILKTLALAGQESAARFLREAYALSQITHPNVVRFYGYGIWNGRPYLAMELASGKTLDTFIAGESGLTLLEIVDIALQIALALFCLHTKGIVHRDLSPMNVMLDHDEAGKIEVKLIDLGLAKLLTEHEHASARPITEAGLAIGTARYMSPEQCNGLPVTEATDVYAWSCILFEMVTGRSPFDGDSAVALMMQHTSCRFPSIPIQADPRSGPVVEKLERLLSDCSEKEPAIRAKLQDSITVLSELKSMLSADPQLAAMKLGRCEAQSPAVVDVALLAGKSGHKRRKLVRLGIYCAMATAIVIGTMVFPWSVLAQRFLDDAHLAGMVEHPAFFIWKYCPNRAGSTQLLNTLYEKLSLSCEEDPFFFSTVAGACIDELIGQQPVMSEPASARFADAQYSLDKAANLRSAKGSWQRQEVLKALDSFRHSYASRIDRLK
jgi:hypothetical protein